MIKKIFFTILFSASILVCDANAAGLLKDYSEPYKQAEALRNQAGFESTNVESVVASIILTFLGLLGIIFVILIVIAGFNWMTANGDDTKIAKAKKIISRAIIGLIIIVSAYAITKFVFTNLPGGGNGGGGGGNIVGGSGTQ